MKTTKTACLVLSPEEAFVAAEQLLKVANKQLAVELTVHDPRADGNKAQIMFFGITKKSGMAGRS
jgi:hypothetical protein